jgi:dipeptidyl aminopeptidase/acylaminoacyl peptidase
MSPGAARSAPGRPFRIEYEGETTRVVRGRVDWPASASATAPVPWVLILHGFKGFMDWGFFPELAARLTRAGMAAVSFNTSGSGVGEDLSSFSELEAFRRGTLTRQLEDVERVRSLASSGALGPLDLARAGLFGHSRGGGVALLHAGERNDYRAVVTWAALSRFDRWDEATKSLWRRDGVIGVLNARTGQELPLGVEVLEDWERHSARFDVLAACRRLRAPALVVHGSADASVEVESSELIAGALPADTGSRALVLEGEGHTFGAVHPLASIPSGLERALSETVAWFGQHLGAKPAS